MNTHKQMSPIQVPPEEVSMLIQELQVAKAELTSGNTTGEIYMQTSKNSAFLLVRRSKAIQEVDKIIAAKRSISKSSKS